jgi:hypothetical protein
VVLEEEVLLMSRWMLPLSCILLCGSLVAGEAGVTVEAQGIRIVKPPMEGNDRLRAFNWFPGTSISLLIIAPQGGLLEIDRKASEVTAFKDDKGKDLSKPEDEKTQRFNKKVEFSMSPTISKDGKVCVTEVKTPGVPSKGATSMTLTGKLTLVTASKKQDFTAASVALAAGTEIKAGDIPFTVKEVGKPKWGSNEYPWSVTLQAKQDLTTVADIAFYDAAGKKVESSRSSSSTMSFGSNVTITRTYRLKAKLDTAKVVVSYWMDMRKVTIPVNLQVGLGM